MAAKTAGIISETIDLLESRPNLKMIGVIGIPMPTVLGFMKPENGRGPIRNNHNVGFGFYRRNGAIGCADPDRHLSFAYLTNYNAFRMSKNGDLILKALMELHWQYRKTKRQRGPAGKNRRAANSVRTLLMETSDKISKLIEKAMKVNRITGASISIVND